MNACRLMAAVIVIYPALAAALTQTLNPTRVTLQCRAYTLVGRLVVLLMNVLACRNASGRNGAAFWMMPGLTHEALMT